MLLCHNDAIPQAMISWKVWRTWSDSHHDTGLRFDDPSVQNKLAPGLIDSEKVKLVHPCICARVASNHGGLFDLSWFH